MISLSDSQVAVGQEIPELDLSNRPLADGKRGLCCLVLKVKRNDSWNDL